MTGDDKKDIHLFFIYKSGVLKLKRATLVILNPSDISKSHGNSVERWISIKHFPLLSETMQFSFRVSMPYLIFWQAKITVAFFSIIRTSPSFSFRFSFFFISSEKGKSGRLERGGTFNRLSRYSLLHLRVTKFFIKTSFFQRNKCGHIEMKFL